MNWIRRINILRLNGKEMNNEKTLFLQIIINGFLKKYKLVMLLYLECYILFYQKIETVMNCKHSNNTYRMVYKFE